MRTLVVFLLLPFFALPVFAGLNVNPSRAEIVMSAGQSYSNVYTITNDYGVPITISVVTKDWFVLPENKSISAIDWLQVSTPSFHLAIGETKELRYQVVIPTQAVGSLVGMISLSPKSETEQGVTLVLSVPVFVTVAGTEKIDWDFTDTQFSNKSGKLQVSIKITNAGNIHLRPVAEAVLFDGKKVVGKMSFGESRPVYPGSYRSIMSTMDVPKKGTYKGAVKIVCAGQEKIKKFKLKINKSGELKITWLKK
ncbi:MAG: hypothetical protein NTU66_04335 [Elusimicrobia bacterium]|nr:hypothetical protein [Elusimicrobiota bacterium]